MPVPSSFLSVLFLVRMFPPFLSSLCPRPSVYTHDTTLTNHSSSCISLPFRVLPRPRHNSPLTTLPLPLLQTSIIYTLLSLKAFLPHSIYLCTPSIPPVQSVSPLSRYLPSLYMTSFRLSTLSPFPLSSLLPLPQQLRAPHLVNIGCSANVSFLTFCYVGQQGSWERGGGRGRGQ